MINTGNKDSNNSNGSADNRSVNNNDDDEGSEIKLKRIVKARRRNR